jgi:two-component system, LytTR family, sensor kinase
MKELLREETKTKPGFLLYAISVFFYVLLSELVYSLLGFQFFIENFLRNLYESSLYLGIATWVNSFLNGTLNKNFPWNANPISRFSIQSLILSLAINLLISGLFIGFKYIHFAYYNASIFVSFQLAFIQFCLYAIVIELTVVADFAEYLLNQWHQSKLQQETFDKEKAQFNLELLRNQINPHFLFNNLNTLSSLIHENQDQASDFLRMLSRVYRNILEYRNKETVSLKEELDFFENYYQLLSIRFKEMLLVQKEINPHLMQKKMIPLTLQMLIENAIKHNVVSKSMPLIISIKTEGNFLLVSNPIQKKESLEYSSGLGLKIINSRYSFLGNTSIEIISTPKLFTIKIPLL